MIIRFPGKVESRWYDESLDRVLDMKKPKKISAIPILMMRIDFAPNKEITIWRAYREVSIRPHLHERIKSMAD